MSRRSQVLCLALAAAFTGVAVALVVRWPLLKPYYEFHRSSRLFYFTVLHAATCLMFGLGGRALLGLNPKKAIVSGFVFLTISSKIR